MHTRSTTHDTHPHISADGQTTMLLCDACDSGYHQKCLTPSLSKTPKCKCVFPSPRVCVSLAIDPSLRCIFCCCFSSVLPPPYHHNMFRPCFSLCVLHNHTAPICSWYCPPCVQPCQKCDRGDVFDNESQRLLLCGTCNAAWHMHCLKPQLLREPTGDWKCRACLDSEEVELPACAHCSDLIQSTNKQVRKCGVCSKVFHTKCVQSNLRDVRKGDSSWRCASCRVTSS